MDDVIQIDHRVYLSVKVPSDFATKLQDASLKRTRVSIKRQTGISGMFLITDIEFPEVDFRGKCFVVNASLIEITEVD